MPNRKNKIREHYKLKPISKYGKTKLFAEKFISKIKDKANFRICIGRIFSFTNSNQKTPFLIPSLKKKINSKDKKMLLENMFHYRDFISIKDLGSIPFTDFIQQLAHKPASSASVPSTTLWIKKSFSFSSYIVLGSFEIIAPER